MSIINLNNMKNKKIVNSGNNKIKKNSGIMEKSLIQYINEGFSADFEKLMKNGYQEMAEINLEYSKLGFEYMLDDVNEYEAWICGVWLFRMANIVVKRGEIFYADLSPVIGSEQGGIRPVIIIQKWYWK